LTQHLVVRNFNSEKEQVQLMATSKKSAKGGAKKGGGKGGGSKGGAKKGGAKKGGKGGSKKR
jgi:hypothetical protein